MQIKIVDLMLRVIEGEYVPEQLSRTNLKDLKSGMLTKAPKMRRHIELMM
jgi:hypothetical protein